MAYGFGEVQRSKEIEILLRACRRSSLSRCFFDRKASITQLRIVFRCLWEVAEECWVQEEEQFAEILVFQLKEGDVATKTKSDQTIPITGSRPIVTIAVSLLAHRTEMLQCTETLRGNLSFYLGGKSPSDDAKWTPNMQAVHATIRFAIATGRLDTQY
ncbi:Poly [ADP-ribose] polymerase 2 [Fusarium oxysporum f. sp. albedinis]|nr:Poly [ADP-ribose] polymerase 2 [Fusarium oxysporum f. sp. albedinis]